MLPLPTATSSLPPVLALGADELAAWVKERNWPAMHARQVRRWLLVGRAIGFAAMSDLPLRLRDELAAAFTPLASRIEVSQLAKDGTRKLLLRLTDGEQVECVMIPDQDRRTVCISTQVGCGMACVFCASGLNGLTRNLEAWEIVEQLIHLRNLLPEEERLTNIVVMGMGEPLANLDNLLAALAVAGAKDGFGIGARHITISTVGLPAKIRRLAELGVQYHLAVSLHAPNEAIRSRIVPTNEKTGLAEIVAAADSFFQKTGRQVTYEYVLLRDVNDSASHAAELARLLDGKKAHVNVIPFNEVEGLAYARPTDANLSAFVNTLRRAGVSVKVRKRKGSEIDAACGQLRRRAAANPPELSPAGGV
jgi:23S rRNA (adenine2503-C2)-methyltransferase